MVTAGIDVPVIPRERTLTNLWPTDIVRSGVFGGTARPGPSAFFMDTGPGFFYMLRQRQPNRFDGRLMQLKRHG